MTTVKICGIRRIDEAEWALDAGADYLGILLSESRRQVGIAQARALMQAVPEARWVAVAGTVDDALWSAMLELPAAAIQLHGPTPRDWIASVHQKGRLAIATVLDMQADVVLLDGLVPGSGTPRDWQKPRFARPIWLAGGLALGGVGDVVRRLKPEGVDVSTGVETDGAKDRKKMRQFVQEVRDADNTSA